MTTATCNYLTSENATGRQFGNCTQATIRAGGERGAFGTGLQPCLLTGLSARFVRGHNPRKVSTNVINIVLRIVWRIAIATLSQISGAFVLPVCQRSAQRRRPRSGSEPSGAKRTGCCRWLAFFLRDSPPQPISPTGDQFGRLLGPLRDRHALTGWPSFLFFNLNAKKS